MSSSITSGSSRSNMSETEAPTDRTKRTHFLNIPRELRLHGIYKYLLPDPKGLKVIVPWDGSLQRKLKTAAQCSAAHDDLTEDKWQWTTLLLVNRELHDEVTAFMYGGMEICLLLTTDPTLGKEHAVFRKPYRHHDPPVLVPPEHLLHHPQDYQMQLMLLEQQNKKRLLLARSLAQPHAPAAANAVPSQSCHQPPSVSHSYHHAQPPASAVPAPSLPPAATPYQPLSSMNLRQAQLQLQHQQQQLALQRAQTMHQQHAQMTQLRPPVFHHFGPNIPYPLTPQLMGPGTGMHCHVVNCAGSRGGNCNHSLQDYQMQLMLLEQQRKMQAYRERCELAEGFKLTPYSRDERDGFLHSCCNEKSGNHARILQICKFPYIQAIGNFVPSPSLEWPVPMRYRALVGTVRVVCDFVQPMKLVETNTVLWNDGADIIVEALLGMSLVLDDVVETLKESGLNGRVTLEMGFVSDTTVDTLLELVKELLAPFERCRRRLVPNFERLVWINESKSTKEELVANGGTTEELCNEHFTEYLKKWKGKLEHDEPMQQLPIAVTIDRLIDEFIYDFVRPMIEPVPPAIHGNGPSDIFSPLRRLRFVAKEAAYRRDMDKLKATWEEIWRLGWNVDKWLMKDVMADEKFLQETERKQGRDAVRYGRNPRKLRRLMENINALIEGKGISETVVVDVAENVEAEEVEVNTFVSPYSLMAVPQISMWRGGP